MPHPDGAFRSPVSGLALLPVHGEGLMVRRRLCGPLLTQMLRPPSQAGSQAGTAPVGMAGPPPGRRGEGQGSTRVPWQGVRGNPHPGGHLGVSRDLGCPGRGDGDRQGLFWFLPSAPVARPSLPGEARLPHVGSPPGVGSWGCSILPKPGAGDGVGGRVRTAQRPGGGAGLPTVFFPRRGCLLGAA